VRCAGLPVRFLAYAALTGIALELVVRGIQAAGAAAVVAEDGPVEVAQAVLALAAACVFAFPLVRGLRGFELRVLLGLACLFAAARELDGFFGAAIGPHAYKLLAFPVALAGVIFAWRSRSVLPDEVGELFAAPASTLIFAGALIVLVHAQVLGQKEIWHALVPDGDSRAVKKTVEECSELTGYLLIVFAAIEVALRQRVRRQ
jgi:hypothetical protein